MAATLLKSKAEYIAIQYDGTNADEVIATMTEADGLPGVVEYDSNDDVLDVWDGDNWKSLEPGDVVVYNTMTERAWAHSADEAAKLFEAI